MFRPIYIVVKTGRDGHYIAYRPLAFYNVKFLLKICQNYNTVSHVTIGLAQPLRLRYLYSIAYVKQFVSHTATHFGLLLFVPVGETCSKSLRHRRFKSDRDKILQDSSSSKYASIDGVGFSI